MTDDAILVLTHVGKSDGGSPVLRDCSARVARGEVVVVCGPSGSGKSTLAKCINGLETFDTGSITVDGVAVGQRGTDMPRLRARIGMVFQHFELYPQMTARENVSLAQVHVLKRPRAEADRRSAGLLARVGLGDKLDSRPSQPVGRPAAAASSSGWRLPARWRWTRRSCCSTSRPPRWIRKWSARCWMSCASWRATA